MRISKRNIKLYVTIIFLIIGYFNHGLIIEKTDGIINASGFLEKSYDVNSPRVDFNSLNVKYGLVENLSNDINVVFCPENKSGLNLCFNMLNNVLLNAKSEIKCAFYELDEQNIANTLLFQSKNGVNVSLIVDDKYLNEKPLLSLYNTSIKIYSDLNRGTKYNNYMHDKYCVVDNKILVSGSTNPTNNGFYKNNNNMIKIESKYLVKNYENDFDQMSLNNKYGSQKKSVLEYNNLSLYFANQSYFISSYMCPQDDCAKHIIEILSMAKKEVLFATFSFTNNDIEKKLRQLDAQGIKVEGVIEKKNRNSRSAITLDAPNLNIYLDKNKHNMHNKYFIVDDTYLITGSMNPSNNGNRYNDENILIIKNKNLVALYKKNYLSLVN